MRSYDFEKVYLDNQKLISKLLDRFYEEKIPNRIFENLPFINYFSKEKLSQNTFSGWEVLFIQHNLGPFVSRLIAMNNSGLSFDRTWILDIPYSTNLKVRKKIHDIGIPKEHCVEMLTNPLEHYTRRQLERLEDLVKKIIVKKPKKLLVIDDGAYFVRLFLRLESIEPEVAKNLGKIKIHLVEQTTRGLRFLKEIKYQKLLKKYKIPVVSIAKTQTKANLESPFIGAAVARSVLNKLQEQQKTKKDLGKILVIGYGSVGKATTKALQEFSESVYVYDKDKKKQKEAKNDNVFTLTKFPKRGNFNTVFGCTGYFSFGVKKTEILADDANLISGSSAAIEFNRPKFIEFAYEDLHGDFFIKDPEITRREGIHATITMVKKRKTFSFLNAGFPINFTGKIESQPYWSIQMTHVLLLAAAKQVRNEVAGLHSLNLKEDYWISKNWLDYARILKNN